MSLEPIAFKNYYLTIKIDVTLHGGFRCYLLQLPMNFKQN